MAAACSLAVALLGCNSDGDDGAPSVDDSGGLDPPAESGQPPDATSIRDAEPDTSPPRDAGDPPETDAVSVLDAAEPEAPAMIVAIGDLHADVSAARAALRLAGAINEQDEWIGGPLQVVQVGDQTDRGPEDRAILEYLAQIQESARRAGGVLHLLNGNHEVMNVQLDFRYVHAKAWNDFNDVPYDADDPLYDGMGTDERHRAAAFRPGGPWARVLADNDAVMWLGDTIFVHGGLHPEHVDYGIDAINRDLRAWMRGEADEPLDLTGGGSVVWDRIYSESPDDDDCATLRTTLGRIAARRVVVGHTVQHEINSACDGLVWRIDTGMSVYYGGATSALRIESDGVTPLP